MGYFAHASHLHRVYCIMNGHEWNSLLFCIDILMEIYFTLPTESPEQLTCSTSLLSESPESCLPITPTRGEQKTVSEEVSELKSAINYR